MTFADEAAQQQTALSRFAQLEREHNELLRRLDLVERAGTPRPPKWLTPKRPKKDRRATTVAMLSDCHFDEVVRPVEIGNANAFNRTIAEIRLRTWADKVIELNRDHLSGVTIDGLCLMLGGDIFSGNLHDLAETNADTLPGSLLHWSEQICAAITLLADYFGKVHVPVVVGNHGRLTIKPRTKLRARDNIDWLLGHMVARYFENVPEVTVSVTDDPDQFVTVYDTVHLLTHGDQVTGGGGIGGIWPPIMRMIARKRTRYSQQPFDLVCCGHWHQLISAPTQGLIVNGSIKGYDEYAALHNFAPEPAQQAMWLVTPEHKVTWSAPVFVTDRAREGW